MLNKTKDKETTVYSLAGNKVFCDFCPGFCCYKLPGAILFVSVADISRMASHFHISDHEVVKRYIDSGNTFKNNKDGSCVFLSNGKICKRCSIHLAKPQQCREFPYDKPCPYLEREDLLEAILPRIEKSLKK